jgi:hypothetical protein
MSVGLLCASLCEDLQLLPTFLQMIHTCRKWIKSQNDEEDSFNFYRAFYTELFKPYCNGKLYWNAIVVDTLDNWPLKLEILSALVNQHELPEDVWFGTLLTRHYMSAKQ